MAGDKEGNMVRKKIPEKQCATNIAEGRIVFRARRRFIKSALALLGALGLLVTPFSSFFRGLYAKTKKIVLPKGTKRKSLVNKNPAELDARNLEITPLQDFGTMGLTDHDEDMKAWRLSIEGHVRKPSKLTYEEIRSLPSIKKNVLLICPGFFVNHGHWEGVSLKKIFDICGLKKGATHVTFRGPRGPSENLQRFPIADVLSDKVFLSYKVNGQVLPKKHGFPIRLVSEDYYGFDWIKYVYSVTVDKIEE
jgi:DMSO/TMAO reductase YedYZ molybdopterin-dependent catalytic subunit